MRRDKTERKLRGDTQDGKYSATSEENCLRKKSRRTFRARQATGDN